MWWERVASWRATLSSRPVTVAAGVAAALAAVVLTVLLLRTPSGPPPQLTLPRANDPASPAPEPQPGASGIAGTAVPGTAPAIATVHAAGAVARPGVYAVPAGARVADVMAAAGGTLPEADLDRLNLAARVGDGDRVSVPRKGDPPPAGAAVGDGSTVGGSADRAPAGGPIDLNTATIEQLDTLPGVGPATAQAIVSYRTRHGRFRSVTELLEVPGIGPSKMEALQSLVRV